MSTAPAIPKEPEVRSPRPPSWQNTPRRVWLRRALFQVHLWVGLLLTLYAIVIGVSGAALVFRTEIERHLQPQLAHLTPSQQRVTLADTIGRVERDRPGWRVASLRDFSKSTEATTLLLRRTGGGLDANYRAVSINPYTGEVLADTMRFAGVLGWLSNLHFYLLAGHTGLLVSGWMALGLVVLCLTGLVVWWPGVRRWRSALVLRRNVRWRRFNWDLHSVVGFWFSASLLLLSITGLYFAFPKQMTQITLFATRSKPVPEQTQDPVSEPRPVEKPMTADEALARARQLLPAAAPPDYLALPSHAGAPIYATGYYKGTAPYSQLVSVNFDSQTGTLLSGSDTRTQTSGQRLLQLSFALHFGSFAGEGPLGLLVKLVWVLAGLAPALLACTGLLMFWNRKLAPRARKRLRSFRAAGSQGTSRS